MISFGKHLWDKYVRPNLQDVGEVVETVYDVHNAYLLLETQIFNYKDEFQIQNKRSEFVGYLTFVCNLKSAISRIRLNVGDMHPYDGQPTTEYRIMILEHVYSMLDGMITNLRENIAYFDSVLREWEERGRHEESIGYEKKNQQLTVLIFVLSAFFAFVLGSLL